MSDHPDIENLPDVLEGIPVRESIRQLFRDPANGTPDNISKAGCLALALKSNEAGCVGKGYVVWNAWREVFSSQTNDLSRKNCANFEDVNSSNELVGEISFRSFHFGRRTSFKRATFQEKTSFIDANFGDFSSFHQAKFYKDSLFRSSAKNNDGSFLRIRFSYCRFEGKADFSNRLFLGSSSFKGTNFGVAPIFHGCELHQDTSFEGAEFPKPTGSEQAARAYRTLKLAFSNQQAIREEQRFFKLEMEEETLRETGLKRLLFKAYKTFSDFGFSITRPLTYGGLGVLGLTAAYGILSWLGQCGLSMQACHFAPERLEFSLLQTLPLPGLDKLSEAASKVFWPEGSWWSLGLSVLVIFQKILSLATLFLVGLALRNLFKLK